MCICDAIGDKCNLNLMENDKVNRDVLYFALFITA